MRTTAMNRHFRLIATLIVATVSLGAGVGEAGVIFPINVQDGTPNPNSAVTVSLFDGTGRDVTDTWLPTWEPATGGPTIYVSFNAPGAAPTGVSLVPPPTPAPVFTGLVNPFWVPPAAPTTSAYPGRCTNYDGAATDVGGVPAANSPDYTFPDTAAIQIPGTQRVGFRLISQDCGGMAVIQATFPSGTAAAGTYTFVVPQDSNHNGIPDIWEAKFCPSTSPCTTGKEDNDTGPLSPSQVGDGIAAFDEYRGFIVSGVHVSTDPRQRDLFVHLVNPQCPATGVSLLGGGTPTFPNDGSGLFDNLASLVPASQVHLLGFRQGQTNGTTNEWVDRFQSFSQQTGFQYLDPITNTVTSIAPADDRRINKNAVFPQGTPNPIVANGPIHRGLRGTECLDISATGPLGTTGLGGGGPDGPDSSLVYTQRIVNYIDTLIDNGTVNGVPRALRVFTFQNGSWVQKTKTDGTTDRDFVKSQAMKFYLAHELSHGLQLTPTVEGTKTTSYGYHHAPGTGSVQDQTIVQKIDRSASGFNSFYIPSIYNGADQSSYKTE
jgi:hypothetical protein